MEDIRLENVSFSYNTEKILNNINLVLSEKKFNTLLGPSGCGKTTILRLIAGFLTPQHGKIWIGDKDITTLPPEKRNISTVFQNYALFQNMTVQQNVAYGLKVRRASTKIIQEKCEEYLNLVRMESYAQNSINELSGGQQQRVAIARALATEPKMLLMDEPMSNLDASLRIEMRDEIREIQKQIGITTLFITHDQQEALNISDYISVMDKGTILQSGTPQEIYFNPVNSKVAHAVGASNDLTNTQLKKLKTLLDKHTSQTLRPENFILSKEYCDEKSIEVNIAKTRFCGSYTEYQVLLGDSLLKVVELNHHDGRNIKKIGEKVFLSCR